MPQRLVVFGGSGDLTRRYLLPALAELHAAGRLPDGFEVVVADRADIGTETYRRTAAGWLAEHAPTVPPAARQALVRMLVSARPTRPTATA
ncbi:MAG TPA: hypothetical protein VG452_00270 [Egibacteraceae bacterium]|nr:hypothetical protein [Egibacteraceae bacterium]